MLLRAEFWGEDGWAWFPDGYNDGAASLFHPAAGYLQTLSRIVGLSVQALPMAWAPTFFAAIALAVQALPPMFLVSDRMQGSWPLPSARLAFALLWLALPNSAEVYVNLTNAQWHLAALAFLVLLSRPPRGRWALIGDVLALALSGLSGPTCLLLVPIAAWQLIRCRSGVAAWRGGLVIAAALVQASFLLQNAGGRTAAPLGAGPIRFAQIVTQHVILGPFTGQAHMTLLHTWWAWQSGVLPVAALMFGSTMALLAFWRGPNLLRMTCIFGGSILAAALIRPEVSKAGIQWLEMLVPGTGQRYDMLPMLAWIGIIMWLASHRWLASRVVGGLLVAGLLFGVWSDWSIPDRRPTQYAARVKAFLKLPKGGAMAFPINPFMELGPMILIRK